MVEFITNHFFSFIGGVFIVLGLVSVGMRERMEKDGMSFGVLPFLLVFLIATIVLFNIWDVSTTAKKAYTYWQEFEGTGLQKHAKATPDFIMRWKSPYATIPQAIGGFIFGIIFLVYWVVFSGILYLFARVPLSGTVLLVLTSLIVSWVLTPLVNRIFWLLLGIIIKHPVEIEAKGWKWTEGLPPYLDHNSLAGRIRKDYIEITGGFMRGKIPSGIEATVKRNKVQIIRKRVQAELDFMDSVIKHVKKRREIDEQ